jgi:hypothetical protein
MSTNPYDAMDYVDLESEASDIILHNQDKLHQIPNIQQLISGVSSEANPGTRITFDEFEGRLNNPDLHINAQQYSLTKLTGPERLCLFTFLQKHQEKYPTVASLDDFDREKKFRDIESILLQVRRKGKQAVDLLNTGAIELKEQIIRLLSDDKTPVRYRKRIQELFKSLDIQTPKFLKQLDIDKSWLSDKKGGKTKKSKNKTRRRKNKQSKYKCVGLKNISYKNIIKWK